MMFATEANAFLERRGWRLSGDTPDLFIEEFVRTKERAAEQIRRNASGDWQPDPEADRLAPQEALVDVGQDDLARLTVADVLAWKDKLLKTKKKQLKKGKQATKPETVLDPKTIRNSNLAAVKARSPTRSSKRRSPRRSRSK